MAVDDPSTKSVSLILSQISAGDGQEHSLVADICGIICRLERLSPADVEDLYAECRKRRTDLNGTPLLDDDGDEIDEDDDELNPPAPVPYMKFALDDSNSSNIAES